jgi:hypothetical protein
MKASIVLSRRVTMPPSDATASSASAMKTLDALTITVMVGGGGAAVPGPLDKAATILSPATAARTRRDMGRSSDADLDSNSPLLSCSRGGPSVRHRCRSWNGHGSLVPESVVEVVRRVRSGRGATPDG